MSITAKLAEVLRLIAEMDAAELESDQAEHAADHTTDADDAGFELLQQVAVDAFKAFKNARKEVCTAAVNLVRDPELAGLVRDKERMDLLEMRSVTVRKPRLYGSDYEFIAVPEDIEGEDFGPSNLREQIDAALSGRDGQGVGK